MSQPPHDPNQPPPYGDPPQPPPGGGQGPAGYEQPHPYAQSQPYGQGEYGQYGQQAAGYGSPMPTGPFYIAHMGQQYGPHDYHQLAGMVRSGQLRHDSLVRSEESQTWFPVKEVPGLFSDKEMVVTAVIAWLVGWLGIDRFYLGYTGLGVAKLLTLGGCGIWQLIDLILIVMRKVPDADGRPLR